MHDEVGGLQCFRIEIVYVKEEYCCLRCDLHRMKDILIKFRLSTSYLPHRKKKIFVSCDVLEGEKIFMTESLNNDVQEWVSRIIKVTKISHHFLPCSFFKVLEEEIFDYLK